MMVGTKKHNRRGVVGRIAQVAWRSLAAAAIALAPVHAELARADIFNTATVTASTPSGATISSPPATASASTTPPSPAITVNKTAVLNDNDGTPGLSAGDTIDFTITAENTGNVAIGSVSIVDTLTLDGAPRSLDAPPVYVGGDTSDFGNLNAGETWTWTASYTVTPADILTDGTINNSATVSGVHNGNGVNDTDDVNVPLNTTVANLVTVKTLTSGNFSPSPGDIVSYSITVTNNGPANATNVSLTDLLPAGITPAALNGTVTAGIYDTLTGVWVIPLIAAGDSETLTLGGTVDPSAAPPPITNATTAATGDQLDPTTVGDILSVTVTPVVSTIDAVDDTVPAPVDSAVAAAAVINVLGNDTLDGVGASVPAVTVTPVGPLPAGITLNPDGTVDVAQFTAPGSYAFDYQICQTANPANCDTATVTLEVERTVPRITGTVFLDSNSNGTFDGGDVVQGGYTVQLVDAGGTVVASTTTAPDGSYLFQDFPPGTYDIIFIDPSGKGAGYIDNVVATAGDIIIDQDLPVDPSGVIYDSSTGLPVSGATVRLTDASGTPLPAACLLPGQQPQTTGADGSYRFDIVVGAAPQCPVGETEYRLAVTSPPTFQTVPSTVIPPQPGALDATTCPPDVVPGGSCALSLSATPPSPASPTPYYLAFLIAAGDPHVVHNHIPLDPIATPGVSGLVITKSADPQVARRGDVVTYRIAVRNTSARSYSGLRVTDTLPPGFSYVPGSAEIDGTSAAPAVSGQQLAFEPLSVNSGDTIVITVAVRIGAQVSPGDHDNVAALTTTTGELLARRARATVRVEAEAVFDCGEVIGKVYEDRNRNGYQDEGEPGIPAARVATVRGTLITADAFGRYSVPCAEIPDADIGSNFILKLDTRSLPAGFLPTTENPRVVRLTRGKVTELNFGVAESRVIRIDLSDEAFVRNSAAPADELKRGIDTLIASLDGKPSILRFTYYRSGESSDLVRQRLRQLESAIADRWNRSGGNGDIPVEVRIVDR